MNTLRRRLHRVSRLRGADIQALWWAHPQYEQVRGELRRVGTKAVVAAPRAGIPVTALRTIDAYLRLRRATCLERCMIVQRWLAAHGQPVVIAIGVCTRDEAFSAHAWLPGFDPAQVAIGYREISRIEP